MSEAPCITERELRSILLFFLGETQDRLEHLAAQPWTSDIRAKLAALGDQVRALSQELETRGASRRSSSAGP